MALPGTNAGTPIDSHRLDGSPWKPCFILSYSEGYFNPPSDLTLTFQILPLLRPLQKALERGVIAQKRIHHKTRAEAEAVDEGVQLAFAHKLCVGVAEAEKQRLVVTGELLSELFLQIVLTLRSIMRR